MPIQGRQRFFAGIFLPSPFCRILPCAVKRRTAELTLRPRRRSSCTTRRSYTASLTDTKANVKAVFAGHLHHLEQIQVDGISYITSGAICGNWWKGAQNGCPEGFLVVDLSSEGNVEANYHSFGWKAAA